VAINFGELLAAVLHAESSDTHSKLAGVTSNTALKQAVRAAI
jgi:hypothetical protein